MIFDDVRWVRFTTGIIRIPARNACMLSSLAPHAACISRCIKELQ